MNYIIVHYCPKLIKFNGYRQKKILSFIKSIINLNNINLIQ